LTYQVTVIVWPLEKLEPGVGKVIGGTNTSKAAFFSRGTAMPVIIVEKNANRAKKTEGMANFIMP
jgi:hypothetical protein